MRDYSAPIAKPAKPGLKKLPTTKFIFVTGGVMSSLGKGLTASALGAVLQARGFTVIQQKLDPYLNVDPGTMSPFQHGEVYVTADGCETDLDLGHYERFTNVPTGQYSNTTSGQIYWRILNKERRGDYLGKTVQVVPHMTGEVKDFVKLLNGAADFALVEIGGTVGDIEGRAFIEAIREFGLDVGEKNCLYMHLTYAPVLACVGEIKTKPTQNAVRDLLELGIKANVVVVRAEIPVPQNELKKIAMFAGLPESHVVSCPDSPTIYSVPLTLHENGLDAAVLDHFGIKASKPDLKRWQHVADLITQPPGKAKVHKVRIAMVGKYVQLGDSYLSVNEALLHGGFANDAKVEIDFVDSEALEKMTDKEIAKRLSGAGGILVPGGFGYRGTEGMIRAITYARETGMPYFGICLGLQLAIVEYARSKAGLSGAGSTEFSKDMGKNLKHPLINMMTEWDAGKFKRSAASDLGGTMRLGSYPCKLQKGSLAHRLYKSEKITERHRHRYEFNPAYREQLEKAGLIFSGVSPTDPNLAEIVELPTGKSGHPFFIAGQFHPEFQSGPLQPHPIFAGFIGAALKHSK